ncbi:MAG: GAF domain-containing protein, partial [Candidatus Rokuibacteriota bacterium]
GDDPARRDRAVAELAVPIRIDERVAGLIHVAKRSEQPFGDRDEAILVELADHAAIAIRNARLFAEAERRRQTAERLAETGRLLATSRDPAVVARRIVQSVLALFDARSSAVYRLDPVTGDLVVVAWAGSYGDDSPTFLPRGMGATGLAVTQGVPVYTPNCLTDPRIVYSAQDRALVEQATFRAVLAVPLTVQGRVIGGLGVGDGAGRVFDGDAVRTIQAFADQAAVALADAWQILEPARSG